MVEKQSGHQIKVLRTYRGGEYDSKYFHDFYKQNGIKKHITARYTPQQNGVVEREKKTIMNMARNILKVKHLSNKFWGEAVACSVYVLNISPTKSVRNKVSQEACTSMSCSVAHLRVFGCLAYARVPKELRCKLYDKNEKYIFLGYNDQSQEYKLYNPMTKKVIISIYVEFKEDEAWDGSTNKIITVGATIPQVKDEPEE
jgi:hypothetical protein